MPTYQRLNETSRISTSDSKYSSSHLNEDTPICALPPELLGYILEMAQTMLLPSEDCFRRFPFIPAQVSRYWRQIALGTPVLWSNLDISPPWDIAAIQTYIDRSKECLIDLRLSYSISHDDQHSLMEFVHPLTLILLPHYHRCRTIEVSGSAEIVPAIFVVLESMQHSTYPHLQRFLVEGLESDQTSKYNRGMFTLSDTPNLTGVRLRGTGLYYFRLPLSNVTELHLARVIYPLLYTAFCRMLQSCSASLVTLAIYDNIVTGWPNAVPLLSAYDMPSLRRIHIYGSMLSVSQLLLSISAPDLEEISIAPVVEDDLLLLEEDIIRAGSPRFPVLKSLVLAVGSTHTDSISSVFQRAETCFPGIETLVLPDFYAPLLLEFLTSQEGNNSVVPRWPQLASLSLRELDNNLLDQLHRFVLDRQVFGAPFRILYLDKKSIKDFPVYCEQLMRQVSIVEADPWLIQQSNAFYSREESRFLGDV